MNKAIEALKGFLDENKWRYETVNETAIRGTTSHECGCWNWLALVDVDHQFLNFRGMVPMHVPSAKRVLAAEYIARANWGLRIGHFSMDWSDGEVQFLTTLLLGGDRELATTQLEHLVFGNHWMMGHYLPGLLQVIYGKVSPKRAVDDADAEPVAQPAAEAEPESSPASKPVNRFLPGAN